MAVVGGTLAVINGGTLQTDHLAVDSISVAANMLVIGRRLDA